LNRVIFQGDAVVRNGEVLAAAVSSPYPGLLHVDSKGITSCVQIPRKLPILGNVITVILKCY